MPHLARSRAQQAAVMFIIALLVVVVINMLAPRAHAQTSAGMMATDSVMFACVSSPERAKDSLWKSDTTLAFYNVRKDDKDTVITIPRSWRWPPIKDADYDIVYTKRGLVRIKIRREKPCPPIYRAELPPRHLQ